MNIGYETLYYNVLLGPCHVTNKSTCYERGFEKERHVTWIGYTQNTAMPIEDDMTIIKIASVRGGRGIEETDPAFHEGGHCEPICV